MTESESEAWVLELTPEEVDHIAGGGSVEFTFDGGVIEQDPRFIVERESNE